MHQRLFSIAVANAWNIYERIDRYSARAEPQLRGEEFLAIGVYKTSARLRSYPIGLCRKRGVQ